MPEMETVACPICESEQIKVLYEHELYTMSRCRGCGFVRQSTRLTADAMRKLTYDPDEQPDEMHLGHQAGNEDLPAWQPKPLEAYAVCVEAIEAVRPKDKPKGLWLDIGAATGSLLLAARNAGYEVGGAELGRVQVEVCKDVHGIDVHHGTLRDAAFPDGCAEVISWRQVMEHVFEVREELQEAGRVLAPDGFLLIEVPNFGGAKYQLGRLRTSLRVSRPFWEGLNLPEHIYYFTIDSLRRLLAAEGFEIVTWETYGKYRKKPSLFQRARTSVRDGLKIGNKLRVVARRTAR